MWVNVYYRKSTLDLDRYTTDLCIECADLESGDAMFAYPSKPDATCERCESPNDPELAEAIVEFNGWE